MSGREFEYLVGKMACTMNENMLSTFCTRDSAPESQTPNGINSDIENTKSGLSEPIKHTLTRDPYVHIYTMIAFKYNRRVSQRKLLEPYLSLRP